MTDNPADGVIRSFEALQDEMTAEVRLILIGMANLVLADAVKRTPVDTGRLRQSAEVVEDPQNRRVWVTYELHMDWGDDEEHHPYALPVHEITTYHHKVGEDHYLRKALDAVGKQMREAVSMRLRARMKSHRGA